MATSQHPSSRGAAEAVGVLGASIALLAMFAALVGAGLSFRARDEARAAASTQIVTIDVELGDMYVSPSSVDVPGGAELVVRLVNHGSVPHDLKWNGTTGSDLLAPGSSAEVSLGVMTASGEAWCTVPGHKAAGMVLKVNVTSAAPPSGASAHDGGGVVSPSPETAAAVIDPQATPAATWAPYDARLAPAPGGEEHRLTMHATEKVIEVAPGVTQELWTFDDQVPGPTLRGKVGDIFTITLVNDGTLGHSIDLHASKVAWNDEMRTIQPGESLVYQFEAKHSGAFMYHCGTAPTLHHIGNGMFGVIIIDPPELAPVDHEFLLVQSEFYLGPEGRPGDLTKMIGEQWDAVVFNGYWNQYKFAPIRVEPDERVRVWVVDDGPSENSAFHIVGTIFDTVFKEGRYTLQPDETHGGSQVLDLQPAQGGFVEFSFDEAGLYPIVTHKFANVGKGALGLFQAGEIPAADAAG